MKTVFLRPLILAVVTLSFSAGTKAQMYGTGMQGGMMSCPYNQEIGDEAESVIDDIRDRQERITDLKQSLKDAKDKQKDINRKLDRAKSDLEKRGLEGSFAAKLIEHITEGRSCTEYQGYAPTGCGVKTAELETESQRSPAQVASTEVSKVETRTTGGAPNDPAPFTATEWSCRVCDPNKKGKTLSGACSIERAKVSKGFSLETCKNSLIIIEDSKDKLAAADLKVANLEAAIESLKDQVSDLKGKYKEAVRDHKKELREQSTEGGCIDCMLQGSGYYSQKRKTDWGGVALNGILGVASIALGNDLQKSVAAQNARLGQVSQSYPSFGYGYPFIMGAIGSALGGGGGGFYGAIGGGMGSGSFGCANGSGGNGYGNMVGGPFGYPQNYFQTPYGGGMYSGYPMGMMGNMMAGGMMGMMNGMMAAGGMMAGGGYPMGMMGGGGMMAGGMMGMMNGMMGMDSSAMMQAQMQMQQQAMQMQQQQMQMYMQIQQRASENYQARQRTVMGLQSELQSLLIRLQQAQAGMSSGGYLDFGASYGTGYSTNPGFPTSTPIGTTPTGVAPSIR